VACRNAGKRLATNAEWQAAALGTPDPGTDNGTSDCNISTHTVVNTGSRSSCVSDVGAFDMVGNLWEWVADWGNLATGCQTWDAAHGNDVSCIGGNGTGGLPGALFRGGNFDLGSFAGVFAAVGLFGPTDVGNSIGFRCAR
jgi:formylglycine-generating enzyme required for sulfatase activity